MSALTDAAALAVDPTYMARSTAALVYVSVQVATAVPDSDQDRLAARRKRTALATGVLADPVPAGERIAWALACSGIVAGADDGAFIDAIRSGWDALAGVTYEDRTGR